MKQRSRILAGLTAFFVVLAGSTLAIVAPASAHHGTITSSVVCQDGKAKVTWNIKNSEDHVAEVTATTGTTGLPVGTQIPVRGSAGFTWTQLIDVGTSVNITVSLKWPKNNATNKATDSESAVNLDCDAPVSPVKPELTLPVCGVSAQVVLPQTTGVFYQKTVLGNGNVKVTASPTAGYKFPANVPSEWTFEIPAVEPCDVTVVPVAPSLSTPECGSEAAVQLTEVTGVAYSQNQVGNVVTVTATPKAGYNFANGTVTSWQLLIPEIVPCNVQVTPVVPLLSTPECGEQAVVMLTEVQGVTYRQVLAGDKVTITATANEGYYFAARTAISWELLIPAVEPCDVEATPVAPTLSTPACAVEAAVVFTDAVGVTYTQTRDGDSFYVTATADEGFFFDEGTVASWELLIPAVEPCDVEATPVAPALAPPVCGVETGVILEDVEGVTYLQTLAGDVATVTATADEGFFFDEDAVTSWELLIPAVEPCDVEATPVAPTPSTPACGIEAEVMWTDVEGVTYAQVRDGDTVTVMATADEGYYFEEGTVTSWELMIPAVVDCDIEVTPVAPALSSPMCGAEAQVMMPTVMGVAYTQVRNGAVVTVTATANDGYVFTENAVTSWAVNIPTKKVCAVVPPVTQPPTYVYNTAWLPKTGAGDVALTGALALLVTAAGVILVRRRSVDA